MAALLLAEERELAAAFLGSFRGEEDLKGALGIPESYRVYGAILLGRPDDGDHRSSSLDRPGPTRSHRLHRGSFGDQAKEAARKNARRVRSEKAVPPLMM
jgi:hypothetical protein